MSKVTAFCDQHHAAPRKSFISASSRTCITFTGKPFRHRLDRYFEAGRSYAETFPPSRSLAVRRNHGRGACFQVDLLEALPDAIVAVDHDGTIVQVNSQARELFGYDRGELIGQKVELLVPESYRGKHRHRREKYAEAPKTRRMGAELDLYGRRRNGSEFPVEVSLSPVSTEKGAFVLSAIRDISDRKRIAEELRRANEELHRRTTEQLGEYRSRLASIIDSSEDAILSKDLNGIITSWNRGAERIYGYAAEEIVGKNISLLTPR